MTVEFSNLPGDIYKLLEPEQWAQLSQKGCVEANSETGENTLLKVFVAIARIGHAVQLDNTPGTTRLYHYQTCRLCLKQRGEL